MRRTILVVTLSALSFIALLFVLNSVIRQLKQSQPGTVYLKPNIVKDNDFREGQITKADKYVVVNSDAHGEEAFTWDQVRYISLKSPSSTSLDKLIESIDLLSKLGIVLTLALFVIGLYQYHLAQKWKREEFLVGAIKDYGESKLVRNGLKMLESLALYPEGRMIELFPDAENPKDRRISVSNEQIYRALTTDPNKDLGRDDEEALIIRDCFDALLTDLGTFYHYVEQNLVTKEALAVNIGYWIELLGPDGELQADHKRRIFAYAEKYSMTELEKLIRKYHTNFSWKRDIPLVVRFHSFKRDQSD